MQSKKTSSTKPRETTADVAGQPPEANTAAAPVKKAPKATASAPPKKMSKAAAAAPARRHRTTATAVGDVPAVPVQQAAQAEVGEMATTPMVMTAAQGAGSESFYPDVVDSVEEMTGQEKIGAADLPASEKTGRRGATPDEIAQLAHSYWVARSHQHGSHEEDWLRAERELQLRG